MAQPHRPTTPTDLPLAPGYSREYTLAPAEPIGRTPSSAGIQCRFPHVARIPAPEPPFCAISVFLRRNLVSGGGVEARKLDWGVEPHWLGIEAALLSCREMESRDYVSYRMAEEW